MNNIKNIIYAIPLSNNDQNLNGYIDKDHDLFDTVSKLNLENILSKNIFCKLQYNFPEKKLYIVTNIIINNPSEEDINKLKISLEIQLLNIIENFSSLKLDKEIKLQRGEGDNIFRTENAPIPKGAFILKQLINNEKEELMYEEFCTNPFVIKEVYRIAVLRKLNYKNFDNKNIMSLGIHQKDNNTGIIFVANFIAVIFNKYKLSMNFLRGFEIDSLEYELGKLMLTRSDFGTFALDEFSKFTETNEEEQTKKIIKKANSLLKKNPISEKEHEIFNLMKI